MIPNLFFKLLTNWSHSAPMDIVLPPTLFADSVMIINGASEITESNSISDRFSFDRFVLMTFEKVYFSSRI